MDTNPPRFLPPDLPDLTPAASPPPAGPVPPRPATAAAPPGSAPRPAPESRRSSRLRTITAGIAVVGVAATAGLGLVAARNADTTTGGSTTTDDGTLPATGADPDDTTTLPGFTDGSAPGGEAVPGFGGRGPGRHGFEPGTGAPAPGDQAPGITVEPPAGATGPGDVSTGGS